MSKDFPDVPLSNPLRIRISSKDSPDEDKPPLTTTYNSEETFAMIDACLERMQKELKDPKARKEGTSDRICVECRKITPKEKWIPPAKMCYDCEKAWIDSK
jgi:hypothetical protein